MQYLLDLFLSGNLNQSLKEDFFAKQENMQYKKIISENQNQYSLEMILNRLIKNNKINELQKEINTIKEEFLYTSFIHGINHNERVLFWTYFLSLHCDLDKASMRIVLDGAKYHDIARVNDLPDIHHGEKATEELSKIVDDKIYQNENNIKLLKGIVELHSLPDKKAEYVMEKYKIENKNLFYTLFSILKDADALDRIRLTYNEKNIFSFKSRNLKNSVF